MEKQFCFDYEHYAALAELPEADRKLVAEAERATANAHAPYSKFRVGAAARLRSGKILYGSNFESEVYPAGLCAERTLPVYAQANYADDPIETLAIASNPSWTRALSLRPVPAGDGRCRTPPGLPDAGHHERPRHGHGARFGGAAAAFHLYSVMRAMFTPDDILYEDNHLLIVNKRCGDLVQPDPSGESALEDQIKGFIKKRDAKPGEVFLGVVHRIDRPVSGAVIFAKTSKALARLNEMIREGRIHKVYWALTEATPDPESGELCHDILRDGKTNRSRACDAPKGDAKQARLRYATLGAGTNYTLVEVELLTGRHHQIRAQLSKIGCPIRGDRQTAPGAPCPEAAFRSIRAASSSSIPCAANPFRLRLPCPRATTCGPISKTCKPTVPCDC